MKKTGMHWFRTDLRIHDNPALYTCLDEVERFIPIFIFDGKTAGMDSCSFNKLRFILQSLKDLERQFANLKINFICFHGKPHEIIETLIKEHNVRIISFEKDTEAIWRERDNLVKAVCKRFDVQVIEMISKTLFDPDLIFSRNNEMAPNTCDQLKELCKLIGKPEKPKQIPDLEVIESRLSSTDDIYIKEKHKVPDIEFFDIKPEFDEQETCLYPGGEIIALDLFKKRLDYEREFFQAGKVKPNWSKPVLFTKEASFSAYIAFGCLSVRKFYWDIKINFEKYFTGCKQQYQPLSQIFWREYFYQLSYKNIHLGQIKNNPMALEIPWDWNDEKNMFSKWEGAKTGFPWIDACMRQLKKEGWIHHMCRNSLAIFLTRGQLFLTWELGLKTFLKYQIDADWSVCAGNWSWISSGSPDDALYDTFKFCPVEQGTIIDPTGEYTKKYIPELKEYPLEYLFEPWKAPLNIQEAAGCIIGRDYPLPCIEHERATRENAKKMRNFFNSILNEDFEKFLKKKLKPSNVEEYKAFIFASIFSKSNSE